MKKILVFIVGGMMTGFGLWSQAQTMKEVPTGLNNVKLYAGCNGFEVKTVHDGRTIAYGHCKTGNKVPPAMIWWLSEYDRELEYAKQTAASGQRTTTNDQQSAAGRIKAAGDSVAPLITSRWRQYNGYNRNCPVDTTLADLGGHPTTGCVATAMAQIMRYWQFPQHGMGSKSYSHDYECWRYGTVSADFANTQYDWQYMPEALTDSSSEREIDAVATLCYQCGVSVNMMYNNDCAGSSGAYCAYAATAFTNTFHYKSNYCLNRNSYTASQWEAILKNELNNGRPILYGGQSIEDTARGIGGGGHAFIADGYDTNGYFHINWGWGGWYDGYFAISMLNPAERYEFNYGQQAVVGVEPEYNALAMPMLVQGIELDGEDFQMGGNVQGSYAVANVGDTIYDGYIGVNVYSPETYEFYGWLDATEVHIQPGDTVFRTFDNPGMTRPVGIYYALGQYNDTPLYVTDEVDNALTCFNEGQAYFKSVDTNRSYLRNVTVCVSFEGEDNFTITSNQLNNTLNSTNNSTFSARNYINATSEGRHTFHSLIANPTGGGNIIAYSSPNPRGMYLPYSSENVIGYLCGSSFDSRINSLINEIADYIDSLGLVNYNTLIDGDGDGKVDNLTIVVKEGEPILESSAKPECGHTASNATINFRHIDNYSIVNEQNDASHYCYALMNALGLPNMSHKYSFLDISPLGEWSIMDIPNRQQPSYIEKHHWLGVGDAPVTIDRSGWYTLESNASGSGTRCYSIATDNDNIFYLIEYRNKEDFFDQGVPSSGITVSRWNSQGDNGNFMNATDNHELWIIRPNSDCDTVQGDISNATITAPFAVPMPSAAQNGDSILFSIDSIEINNGTANFHINITNENDDEGINQPESINKITIFPNPTNGVAYIVGCQPTEITVYSADGRLMSRCKDTTIDLSPYNKGVYYIKIVTPNEIKTLSVVKY